MGCSYLSNYCLYKNSSIININLELMITKNDNDMMMLNALSFEQIINIMHNMLYCEKACYDAINSNDDKKDAFNRVCMAFDELTEAIKSMSDKDDWQEYQELYVLNVQKRLSKLNEED